MYVSQWVYYGIQWSSESLFSLLHGGSSLPVPLGQKGFNMIPPYPPTPIVSLAGKNVLVIGASKGLGYATASMFVTKGCNVVGTSRYPKCYNQANYTFPLLKVDIRSSKKVKCFFDKLMTNQFSNGKIDILVNCPGMHWYGDLQDADGEDISDILSFQVGGFQRVVYRALPHMKHSSSTKVISFGSIAGELPAGIAGYCIAKRALHQWNDIHMVEALKRKAFGLSVHEPTFTLVEPGFIQSKIGLYEIYKSADTDMNDLEVRASRMMFLAMQNATAVMNPILGGQPSCPASPAYCQNVPQLVSDAICQIAIAPQPSVRYMVDPSPPMTNFLSAIQGANVLPADDVINMLVMPITAGFFHDPANVALAQTVLQASYCN